MTLKSGFQKERTLLFSILEKAGKNNVAIFAAAADCFLFMSLVPILMLLVSMIRFLPFDQADVMHVFIGTVPVSVFIVIQSIVDSIYTGGETALTVSLFLMLFSASAAMRPLMKGLDVIYGDERNDSLPVFFLRAVLYLLMIFVIIILSIVLLVYGGQTLRFLHAKFPDHSLITWLCSVTDLLRYAVTLCVLTLCFLLVYCRFPARRRRASGQWPGAVFCALSWAVFSWGFSLYVSVADSWGAYGYIGTIMVAMMWGYFCLTFLLYGGCINAALEQR